MKYPQDFQDPRHQFIGFLKMDTDKWLLSIEYNDEAVAVGGSNVWPWEMADFKKMLTQNGLKLTKKNGGQLIQIANRTGKYVR